MRIKGDEDLAAVHALEQPRPRRPVPQREGALAEAAEALAAVDEKVDEHEAALDALVEKRAAFAAGDDELSRRCNEIVRDALRGETMRMLCASALTATPTPDDDAAVDQLTVVRVDLPRVEEEAKRLLSLHETNRERATKLEEIRKRFKESRYDAVSSEFVNGA